MTFLSTLSVGRLARWRNVYRVAGCALVLRFMACNASIRMHWWRFEQQLAREFEPLFERFEPNVRIAWTYLGPTGFVEPAHRHWIQLAVLHKPLMVSGLFTLPGQPPLRYAPACREAAEGPGLDGASLNCGTSSADSP